MANPVLLPERPPARRFFVATNITDANFEEEVINSSVPVLVDFWAEWCGPCKMIGPSLEEISEEMGEKVKVVKINIDENPSTPSKYGVRGIPTLMVFKDGEVKSTQVGANPKGKIADWIESSI
jgi:thioredoxin 1